MRSSRRLPPAAVPGRSHLDLGFLWIPNTCPAAAVSRHRIGAGKRAAYRPPTRVGMHQCCAGEKPAPAGHPPLFPAELQLVRAATSVRPCPEQRDLEAGKLLTRSAPKSGRPRFCGAL